MKIGIILHPYGEDKPAGLARTIFEFVNGMLAHDRTNDYIIFLKQEPKVRPQFAGANWRIEILGHGYFWLNRLKKRTQCDVYLFNTPVLPIFWKPKKSMVLALDFAYYYFPPAGIEARILNRLTFWYHKKSLHRADGIVAISEATKRDTVKLFDIPPQRIQVVLCGYKNVCAASEVPVALPEKFFLYVGVLKERKNVLNVVRAFRACVRSHPAFALVIGGKAEGAYADQVRRYIDEEGIGREVIFVGHLNDGQLSYLYKKAFALVFPSFIEGFGYPVLEAMSCGLPVITSKTTSLGEICQNNSALLADPASIIELTQAMTTLAENETVRKELIKNGRAQAERFSWEKAGRELIEILTRVSHA